MLDFKPPKDSQCLISITNLSLPLYMKVLLHDTTLSVSAEALEKFKALKGQRAMICPNHACRHDPMVMFAFSKMVGEQFNYIAAREVFDWNHGLNGWWLQRMGAYSVVRGAVDRESFKTTRHLLSSGKKKLVLFPEGEISSQNDTLMPLESGAAQMSFWALSDIKKQSPSETLKIVPIALKYTYKRDITSTLRGSLVEMERKLGLSVEDETVDLKIRKVAERLLSVLEREYGQKSEEGEDMNPRVTRLRRLILKRLADRLQVKVSEGQRELEQVRILRNHIDDIMFGANEGASDYEKKIHREKVDLIKSGYSDLDRVVRFIAVYDGYVTEHKTQERMCEVVDRLEREIHGVFPSIKGPRRVYVDVGDPIELDEYMDSYKANKKETVEQVTDNLFDQISTMLQTIERKRRPVLLMPAPGS